MVLDGVENSAHGSATAVGKECNATKDIKVRICFEDLVMVFDL